MRYSLNKAASVHLRFWALAIPDLDFEVYYELGATHFLPDYFSRAHHDDPHNGEWEPKEGCELIAIENDDSELTLDNILGEQLKDKECSEMIPYLERVNYRRKVKMLDL